MEEDRIIEEFFRFFAELYKSEDRGVSVRSWLKEVLVSKLSVKDKAFTEREVEDQEIEGVVQKLTKGKSPGLDGIPNEFFQRFWDSIKADLGELIRGI